METCAAHHQHWLVGQKNCVCRKIYCVSRSGFALFPRAGDAEDSFISERPSKQRRRIMKLAVFAAVLTALYAPIPAGAIILSLDGVKNLQSEPVRAKRKVIDKSCLMVCEKWTDDGCEKWVMKCKGDPGYPKGITLRQ
jgi:hypothetical protein